MLVSGELLAQRTMATAEETTVSYKTPVESARSSCALI
jgi:hypothetical protein